MIMKLRTLGTLALDSIAFHRQKPLLLVAYLALEGSQERTYLSRVFWPEASQPAQRLRSTLDLLRSGAPGAADRFGSKITTSMRCDAVELQVAFENGEFERCVALYEGVFLEGLSAGRLGLELEEWVFATRERIAECVRHALLMLSKKNEADPKRAAHYAREAYLIAGAGIPSPRQIAQILRPLRAVDDPLAKAVERDADDTPTSDEWPMPNERGGLGLAGANLQQHNLLTPPTALLGRGALLLELEQQLASLDTRLLTLTGMGGVGKTRLATELAWRFITHFDAVYFVALAAVRNPDEVLSAVAHTLRVKPVAGQPLHDVLVTELRSRNVLLILDNFEHVLGAATMVADLLSHCPALKVVVTSRSGLRVRGEHEVIVQPLPTPPANAHGLRREVSAHDYASVALFCARAAEASNRGRFTSEELITIGDVCRRVDGIPLAIELVASRTKLLSPAQILERLDRSLDLLAQGAVDLPERHHSLRRTLVWSYNLLTPDEQKMFRYLGAAPGGCDLKLAEALWRDATTDVNPADQEDSAVLELLSSLLDKSLIVRTADSEGKLRVTMLETVRRFAAETLALDSVELRASLERMFIHLSARVSRLREPTYNAETDVMVHVSAELENMRAAWLWALSEGRTANLLQVIMFNFFAVAGRYQDGILLFTEAIRVLDASEDAETKGRLYGSLAWFYYRLGDIFSAKNAAEESVAALRHFSGSEVLGVALETYAGILYGMGDYAGAHIVYSEAYSIYEAAQKVGEHLSILSALGLVASAQGEYVRALELFGQVLKLAKPQGAFWPTTETLSYVGEVYRITGDLDASRLAVEESYVLSQTTSETYARLVATYQLSLTTLALDDMTRAEVLFDETLQAAHLENVPELVARAHLGLARTAASRGAIELVTEHLLDALLTVKDTGLGPVKLSCLITTAELSSLIGIEDKSATLLHAVLHDPATPAHERRRAAALLEAADLESPKATRFVPSLIEQVVERLVQTRANFLRWQRDPT